MRQESLENVTGRLPAAPKLISPGAHAALDYGVASSYFALWARMRERNSAAAALACVNGCMVLGLALMTDYPGGVFRTISFKTHRTMDWIQAGMAALGPMALGFGRGPDAMPFYGQAMSEVGVIAATDWDAA